MSWKEAHSTAHGERGRAHFASLFAILCSIAHSAEKGEDVFYISRYAGDGRLLAMINSKLSSASYFPYADLLETFIGDLAGHDLLTRASLRKLLAAARGSSPQIDSNHPVWQGFSRIFPEALDGLARAELIDLGKLPIWAGGRPAPPRQPKWHDQRSGTLPNIGHGT